MRHFFLFNNMNPPFKTLVAQEVERLKQLRIDRTVLQTPVFQCSYTNRSQRATLSLYSHTKQSVLRKILHWIAQ